ncbi:amino acid permease [Streptomyces sp. NPDC002896]|uniref:APC family permease n=1 Tax=Streptomyces sp. NPDC002896 TaxID=3154438 RepID=UPI003316FC04
MLTDNSGVVTRPPAGRPAELEKKFTLWSAFALSVSDLSPIVGLYGVFALGLTMAGPAFWWAFPVVLAGQLLVTGVFGELVSRWPMQGSVYQWARQLIGPRFGWFTNWAYMWGLTLALAALAYSASLYLAGALGLSGQTAQTLLAIGVVVFASAANMSSGGILKALLYISLACEVVATLVMGTVLLFGEHSQSLSSLFSTAGTGHGMSWLTGPFLGVAAIVGWSFVGFESAGSIAEEVKDSRRVLPKAMTLSLLAVGLLVMYASFGILMSVPDLTAVMSGTVSDPIAGTLQARLGSATGRVLLALLAMGFTASFMAVQTAVTRGIWASARDRSMPGARVLGRLSARQQLPVAAIVLTALVAAGLQLISASHLYSLLLTFASAGFYLSYGLPVVAAAYVRLRGRWQPGPVSLGRWGAPVTYAAAVWIVLETVNIAWPRAVNGVWYLDWGLIIMTAVLGLVGAVLCWWVSRSGRLEESSAVESPVPVSEHA